MKKIFAYTLLILELIFVAYISFISYLISSWFLNDDLISNLTNTDWITIGISRLLGFTILALGICTIAHYINKKILINLLNSTNKNLNLYFSVIIFSTIFIASLCGVIQFIVTKPYI